MTDIVIGMLRNPARITLALVLALLFAVALTASPARAATTFTVNSTADPGTGSCDAAECTLREAINAANSTTDMDTINFNIPDSGVKSISPTSPLPAINYPVTIDGYTQGVLTPDPADDAKPNALAKGTNAVLKIELNGTNAAPSASWTGLQLNSTGAGSTIRGLVINRFTVGIRLSSGNNHIEGNYIGTDASGTAPLGNSFDGVAVSGANNAILSNAIFSNGELGIDVLGNNGVTQNDPQDPDFGANNLQNFPVIGSASLNSDGTVTISGTLNSTPSTTFTVQLFSSPQADPSGFGEGKTFLGEKTGVMTDSSGDASFSFTSASAVPSGEVVSATATDPSGNTSEFSQVTVVQDTTAPDPPVIAGPPNNSFNTTGDAALSGTAEANTTVEIFEDTATGTTSRGTTPVNSSGAWSKTVNSVTNGSHTYTAKATDAANNTSAASNARTVIVDTRKPTVKRVVPVEDATDVAPGTNVYAFFSEPMRAASIKGTTFKLYKKGSTTQISADVTLDPSNSKKAILDPKTSLPNGYLERGVTYKAVVSTGAKDAAGNPLTENKVWFFTVKP